jgi:hypothetical protein
VSAHVQPLLPQGAADHPVSYMVELTNLAAAYDRKKFRFVITMSDGKIFNVNMITNEWRDALRIITTENLPHIVNKRLIRSMTVEQQ